MIRTLNTTQLQRILKGEDLEFRITEFAIQHHATGLFEGLVIPYDLNFKECAFGELIFKNCKFHGNISFRSCTLKSLKFEECQLRDVEVDASATKELQMSDSVQLHKFHVGASSINNLNIERNHVFEAIEVACQNSIVSAHICDNGNSELNSFKSTLYICPERFDSMVLRNNTSEILHIGTIGQYSSFEVENYNANLVLFSNCNSDNAKVVFENIQPIDPFVASVCIVNSNRIIELKHEGVFSNFRHIKKYDQSVDLRNYSRVAG